MTLFIVEQQVSLASAKAVFERLVNALGVVTAQTMAAVETEALIAAGLTRQKQRYLRGLAALIIDGSLDLETVAAADDDTARQHLLAVPGIGPWTADVYLLSALRRPDVWPMGDRALQVGVGDIVGLPQPPTPGEMEALGETWRPLRSVAARLVWHDYLARRGRAETEVAGLGR